jgi:hypothetical protein
MKHGISTLQIFKFWDYNCKITYTSRNVSEVTFKNLKYEIDGPNYYINPYQIQTDQSYGFPLITQISILSLTNC